jgi:hypothetical protein
MLEGLNGKLKRETRETRERPNSRTAGGMCAPHQDTTCNCNWTDVSFGREPARQIHRRQSKDKTDWLMPTCHTGPRDRCSRGDLERLKMCVRRVKQSADQTDLGSFVPLRSGQKPRGLLVPVPYLLHSGKSKRGKITTPRWMGTVNAESFTW